MDWLSWVPSPLRSRRKSAEAQHRRDRRPVIETAVGRPLVFNTSQDACVRRPHGAALASRVLLGVGDGSPAQGVEGFAQLPSELLGACKQIAEDQLLQPNGQPAPQEKYQGPVVLLKEAFDATQSPGSTTVALATLDNSTVIHGQLHPMVAMLTVGGCQMLQLRRRENYGHAPSQASPGGLPDAGRKEEHALTETERKRDSADGELHSLEEIKNKYDGIYSEDAAQDYFSSVCEAVSSPPVAEVNSVQVPSNTGVAWHEFEIVFRTPTPQCSSPVRLERGLQSDIQASATLEAIEAKSSVRCASARQGDIVILLGADTMTDVCIDSLLTLCHETLGPSCGPHFVPISPEMLRKLSRRIVKACVAQGGFTEGQQVQCRDRGDNKWLEGTVKNLSPLRVQPQDSDWNGPCTWDEVRLPQATSTATVDPFLFSIVVAEVVEWAGGDLSSSSCETALERSVLDTSMSSDDLVVDSGVSPVIEGFEDMHTVQCAMNIGEFGVLFQAELPKARMPTWASGRTREKDIIRKL